MAAKRLEKKLMKGLIGVSILAGAGTVASPAIAADCVDTDGDGWGWDGEKTCDPNPGSEPTGASDDGANDDQADASGAGSSEMFADDADGSGDAEDREASSDRADGNGADNNKVFVDDSDGGDFDSNEADGGDFDSNEADGKNVPELTEVQVQAKAPEESRPSHWEDDTDLPVCIDTDGDGWGWDGVASCKMDRYEALIDIFQTVTSPPAQDGPASSTANPPNTPSNPSRWDSDCEASKSDWRLSIDVDNDSCVYNPLSDGSGVTVYVVDGRVDVTHDAFDGVDVAPPVSFTALRKSADASFDSSAIVRPGVEADDYQDGPAADSFFSPTKPPPVKPLPVKPPSVKPPQPEADVPSPCGTGHGTAVASLIASEEVGVASGVTLAPVQTNFCIVDEGNEGGYEHDFVEGLQYILDDHKGGPAIVNMSVSMPGSAASPQFNQLLSDLNDDGVLLVSAAGNDGRGACRLSPAGNGLAGNITVGSLNGPNSVHTGTNHGACVDVYAPTNVRAADDFTGKYKNFSGTSASTPIVSGIAAAYWSLFPDLTPEEVAADIKRGSRVVAGSAGDCEGSCLAPRITGDPEEQLMIDKMERRDVRQLPARVTTT